MENTRNTLQREIVLQKIGEIQGHATADMIYDKIHQTHPSISKATVYRNLNALEKQGKVMRIEIPDGADYFEIRKRNHYHIKCSLCGRIFDASLPYMPQLLELEQQADKEFSFSAYTLLFEGLCPQCKNTKINDSNKEET